MFISTANILRLVFCHELLSLACEINANILATCKTLIKYEAGEKKYITDWQEQTFCQTNGPLIARFNVYPGYSSEEQCII